MKKFSVFVLVVFVVAVVLTAVFFDYVNSAFVLNDNNIELNFVAQTYVCLIALFFAVVCGIYLFVKFLKTQKITSLLFFSVLPITAIAFLLILLFVEAEGLQGNFAEIFKIALNLNGNEFVPVYWILVVCAFYIFVMFVVFGSISLPIRRIETIASKLTNGEVQNLHVGGSKQFLEIEHSLRQINQNYKEKNNAIKKVLGKDNFVPQKFVRLFSKNSVDMLEIGQVFKRDAFCFCVSFDFDGQNKNKDIVQSYENNGFVIKNVLPILRKNNSLVCEILLNQIYGCTLCLEECVKCAKQIFAEVKKLNKEKDQKVQCNFCINKKKTSFEVVSSANNQISIFCEKDEILQKLNIVCNTLFVDFVATSCCFAKSNCNIFKRRIGSVVCTDGSYESVYQILQHSIKSKRLQFQKTKKDFEKAVVLYEENNKKEALVLFEKTFKENKADSASYAFYNLCLK